MAKLIFKEAETENNLIKVYSGLASPYEEAGDDIFIKNQAELVVLTVCDGVSSSKSPHKSSKKITTSLEKFFKRKKKLNFNEYIYFLNEINTKLFKKELASTFSQIIITTNKVYTFNLGDSQTFLFNQNRDIIYESWPHNIGFSNNKENPSSHIITNWVGSRYFRMEFGCFERSDVNSGLIFSDGILDLMKIENINFKKLEEDFVSKFNTISDENLLDDSSYIFFKSQNN